MFYRYEIKNNGKEDILYLYLDMKSEFSRELTVSHDNKDLSRRTNNFIINNNINFNGNKVFLIIDNIVVKTVDISTASRTAKNNPDFTNKNFLINLKIDEDSYIEVSLEKYLLSSLGKYFNDEIEDETLKCLSILYRTYAYKEMKENHYILAYNDFNNYQDISEYRNQWNKNFNNIYNKLLKIINETDCLFITYNDEFILPFIHFCNNGYTYTNKNYKYLTSVSSLWDLSCINNKEIIDFDYENISKLLNTKINKNSKIKYSFFKENKQINKITINNEVFSGEEIKKLLSLKSLSFSIILYNNFMRIITFGYGNFLGLSIYGANELSHDGVDYPNILKYYFPDTKLNKYVKELL